MFSKMIILSLSLGMLSGMLIGAGLSRRASTADAATASNLATIVVNSDRFRNYDFLSQTVSSTNVDWALAFIFSNNAEIDKVKNNIFWPLEYRDTGGTMYGRIQDDGVWEWDQDAGRKEGLWCATDYHTRFYADPDDDRNYNITWGYYILASTHEDFECIPSVFGWSENAEEYLLNQIAGLGYNTFSDARDFANSELPAHWDTGDNTHYWNNNQYASRINVP